MNIQSNILQGISLASLLWTQNPNVQETARVNREYKLASDRAASLRGEAQKEIRRNKDNTVALDYTDIDAETGEKVKGRQDVAAMSYSRKAYMTELEKMYDLKPTEELATEIGGLRRDIDDLESAYKRSAKGRGEAATAEEARKAEIRERAKTEEEGRLEARTGELAAEAREAEISLTRDKERARYEEKEAHLERRAARAEAAEERRRAREEAEASARVAEEEEARRLAISRSITEGIYSTDPAFDPRYTGGKKK